MLLISVINCNYILGVGYLYKVKVYIKYIDKLKKQLILSNGLIIYFKQVIEIS